jgi:hypothetical protein
MTDATKMQTKQESKPSSPVAQKADGRGWYKLYNDQ